MHSINEDSQQERRMKMENTAAEPLQVYWVDPAGVEVPMTKLAAGRQFTVMTASGHAFRAYMLRPDGKQKLALEHRVEMASNVDQFGQATEIDFVRVMPCGPGAKPFIKGSSRKEEDLRHPSQILQQHKAEEECEAGSVSGGGPGSSAKMSEQNALSNRAVLGIVCIVALAFGVIGFVGGQSRATTLADEIALLGELPDGKIGTEDDEELEKLRLDVLRAKKEREAIRRRAAAMAKRQSRGRFSLADEIAALGEVETVESNAAQDAAARERQHKNEVRTQKHHILISYLNSMVCKLIAGATKS